MQENSNVSYGVELEKINERFGQFLDARASCPFSGVRSGKVLGEKDALQRSVDTHNQVLTANVAALPAGLRDARAAAIARSL
jgi:hypothetical protein